MSREEIPGQPTKTTLPQLLELAGRNKTERQHVFPKFLKESSQRCERNPAQSDTTGHTSQHHHQQQSPKLLNIPHTDKKDPDQK